MGSETTGAAYRRQFQDDMARFLQCREARWRHVPRLLRQAIVRRPHRDQGRVLHMYGAMIERTRGATSSTRAWSAARRWIASTSPRTPPRWRSSRPEAVDADGSFVISRLEVVMGTSLVANDLDEGRQVGRWAHGGEQRELAHRASRRRARRQGVG
ncbi:hypothetical protein ABZP36_002844 [Zizania latifolia]